MTDEAAGGILDDTTSTTPPKVRRWEVTIERKIIVYAATSGGATSHAKQWINGLGSVIGVVEVPMVDADARVLVDEAPVVSRK
jgi:hypothetical protein